MIEYVKVKHNEECYICHSRENVKTLRVAADGSNAANTIAFCYKCAGAVSRILNIPMTFERSLDGEVVCPHCRTIIGFDDDIGYPSDVSHVKDTFKIVPAVLVDIREALCKECAQKEGK